MGKTERMDRKREVKLKRTVFRDFIILSQRRSLCFYWHISFSFVSFKGCYRKSNIGNTEIKNGIETEKTDSLDLVSQLSLNVVHQCFPVHWGLLPTKPIMVIAAQINDLINVTKLTAQQKSKCQILHTLAGNLCFILVKCSLAVGHRHYDRG